MAGHLGKKRLHRPMGKGGDASVGPSADPVFTQPYGNAAMAQMCMASPSHTSASSSSSGGTSSSTGTAAPAGAGAATKPSTADILRDYQVQDDTMTQWEPSWVGWLTDPKTMTQTEADLLDQLQTNRGLLGLSDFKDTVDNAYAVSEAVYGGAGAEDGHQDAFRHMYWNVQMARELGPEFAAAFATAHEGVPGNPADREAMDLYNNEVGRRIAAENPDATDEELQQLVRDAIDNGEAIVIDSNGDLAFSDTVAAGNTGTADDAPATGGKAPPEWNQSY